MSNENQTLDNLSAYLSQTNINPVLQAWIMFMADISFDSEETDEMFIWLDLYPEEVN